jgi:hypothetical protein
MVSDELKALIRGLVLQVRDNVNRKEWQAIRIFRDEGGLSESYAALARILSDPEIAKAIDGEVASLFLNGAGSVDVPSRCEEKAARVLCTLEVLIRFAVSDRERRARSVA